MDHHTYVFLGDGCLMEGISHEVCSLAGTLGLGKLICLYDDNGISIDGHVTGWFSDDTPHRFEAYGWQVIADVDGHDPAQIGLALEEAKREPARPTLICCKTVIGKGSPKLAGTHDVHGAPLGDDEIAATRAELGWTHPPFEIPAHIYAAWDARARGAALETEWKRNFEGYSATHPELAAELERRVGGLADGWTAAAAAMLADATERARRSRRARRRSSHSSISAVCCRSCSAARPI